MSCPQLKSPNDAKELRDGFSTFPTGVTVVTCARSDGTPVGVTANSFVSLSLSPPLVSVALHQAARRLGAFIDSGKFAINVLRADQHGLSALFARHSECSYSDVRLSIAPTGHVLLDGAAACFLCRLSALHPVGDHVLLVGEVEQFSDDARVEPLAFMRGRYGTFRPAAHTPVVDSLDQWSATGWG